MTAQVPDGERETEPVATSVVVGPGATMGRYRLLEEVGQGGMGVVFAAHDPELHRTVAVKVLRPDVGGPGSAGEQRLRREGQTMAQLTHPNVIRVYDVGVESGTVFVAMEYVAGGTLKDWLAAKTRRVEEILGVFAQAGRGLTAAHEAGLVHRDFKPSNVLVSEDGRVLVSDFGLARLSIDEDGHWIESDDDATSPLGRTLTRGGALVGTPAFMAPEQHRGRSVDARADQFSFCVSLWRALYVVPPYAGDNWRALAETIEGCRLAAPPASARVPAHIHAALVRGLASEPGARFASMRELLDALADDPLRRRRRRRAVALLGALLVAGLVASWTVGRRVGQHPCAQLDDRFAGIWDVPTRRQVHDAFLATSVPYAETTFAEVARQLDGRAAAWTAMRQQSCESTRVRKVQSDSMFDLRAGCLERRARDISVFVDGMRHVSAAAMHTAAAEAADVGDITLCGDVATLSRRAPLPDDRQRRQTIAAIEHDLEPTRALVAAGRYRDADAGAQRLIDRARAAGYAPLLAEALAVAGKIQEGLARSPAAEKLFEESALIADAGGDDESRFADEVQLIKVVGYEREREADGALHAQRAQAILQRLGDEPRRQATLEWALATQDWWHGHYEKARGEAEHSVRLFERVDAADPDLVRSLHMLSITQQELNDFTGSLVSEERARAIGEKSLGANHPTVAQSWETSGGSLRLLGRYAEAERHLTRGLEILEVAAGPQSNEVASALRNLGTLYLEQQRYDDAIRFLRRGLDIARTLLGPEHSRVADGEEILGSALSKAGHKAEAEVLLKRSVDVHRRQLGRDNPATASAVRHLGDHYLRAGEPARAMPQFEESLRALEASQGAHSPLLSRPLNSIAQAAIMLHDRGRAIQAYERALAVTTELDPLHPSVEFELAKLLRPSAQARAAELGRKARAAFVAQGASAAADVAKVDAWLRVSESGSR
jgi:eukaryotic-like serine/threonine-protein kinase